MKYYIRETVFDEIRNKTAASKAREDINAIADHMGFLPIEVEYDYSLRKKKGFLYALKKLSDDWKSALNRVEKGDILLIQFPLNHHPLSVEKGLDRIHKRGGKVVFLIHDVDTYRVEGVGLSGKLKKAKIVSEDRQILKRGDAVITHNRRMSERLLKDFPLKKEALVELELFDYLCDGFLPVEQSGEDIGESVVIAGTLRKGKAGYAYQLPVNVSFNLYGVGYENDDLANIHYFGSFHPTELLRVMRGKFGLVWDGGSSKTCDGPGGQYLKINNPHKMSLYLCAGLPVIVWKESAVADFVTEHGCGIAVDCLEEIKNAMASICEEEYGLLRENALKISQEVRRGAFTKKAIGRALELVGKKDE